MKTKNTGQKITVPAAKSESEKKNNLTQGWMKRRTRLALERSNGKRFAKKQNRGSGTAKKRD